MSWALTSGYVVWPAMHCGSYIFHRSPSSLRGSKNTLGNTAERRNQRKTRPTQLHRFHVQKASLVYKTIIEYNTAVDHTLVWMQMLGGVFLRTTESADETCEMIRMFTKVCLCRRFSSKHMPNQGYRDGSVSSIQWAERFPLLHQDSPRSTEGLA